MEKPTSLKTTDGERLIWWRESADEDYWAGQFIPAIQSEHAKAALPHQPLLIRLLERHLPKDGKIIEAGCGHGRIVATLRQRGFDVEGIDYSADLVREVQQLYPDLPVKVGNVLAIDAPDHYYHGYISIGVIEHTFEGCQPFLREAYRVMRSGGRLCITVPYFSPLRQSKVRLGRYPHQTTAPLPFYQYGFKRRYLRAEAEQAGFRVIGFAFYAAGSELFQEMPLLADWSQRRPRLRRFRSMLNDWVNSPLLAHMMMIVLTKP